MSDEIEHDKSDTITALRAEIERLGKDYQSARDAHDMLLAENEKIIAALWEILDKPRDADKSYAELFIDVIYEVRALLRKK